MSGLQVRMDVHKLACGHIDVAWGLRATDPATPLTDELWLLYSLEARDSLRKPRKYASSVTHELTAYSLDGSRIAFTRSLWDQKTLIPELPAQVGFQFAAEGDHDALKQVQVMMAGMLAGVAHMPTTLADWMRQFPDGVVIPRSFEAARAQTAHTEPIRHPPKG